MGNAPLDKAGVDVIVGKVVSFDPKAHSVTLTSDQVLNYERLVLATGTEPVLPPIPGIGKEGVFTIRKSMSAMTERREKVHKAKGVVIIGGGFIGADVHPVFDSLWDNNQILGTKSFVNIGGTVFTESEHGKK